MSAKCDLHIHTKYLGCANETMELEAIARRCREVGVECIGITDHLNTPDRLELHRPILADIHALHVGGGMVTETLSRLGKEIGAIRGGGAAGD